MRAREGAEADGDGAEWQGAAPVQEDIGRGTGRVPDGRAQGHSRMIYTIHYLIPHHLSTRLATSITIYCALETINIMRWLF